jgi:undecaprenyl phosphate-alpha-L-ara4N flippase subunit ArnF
MRLVSWIPIFRRLIRRSSARKKFPPPPLDHPFGVPASAPASPPSVAFLPMDVTPAEPPPATDRPPQRGPSLLSLMEILFCALAGTASEIALKIGANETASRPTVGVSWLGLSGLESIWVWVGIIFTILSFVAWVRAVRVVPLSIAFTLSNVIHVFIPLSCWIFLHEAISPRRWAGIALVIVGLAIIARPFARLDQKLEEAL